MGKTLRSTARQNFSISLPRDGARWLAGHLALALRLALAAATAAMSFVVLSEDPPHQEMRLLLAALAVSLFLFSLIERSVVHHLSLIHISEPTRLGMISYAVFCLK